MARSRERDFTQPELGQALAWLRARQYLTQQEVVAAVNQGPESLSSVYYQMLETGKRQPSAEKLDAVLQALSSDRSELEGLVAARVWEGSPSGRYRISARRPRPEAYTRAAEEALKDVNGQGFWSTPVEGPPASFSARPQSLGRSPLLRSGRVRDVEIDGQVVETPSVFAGGGTAAQDDLAAELRGQLAELSDHFLRLSPKARQELLTRARKLRRG
jgi:transcriptional regulator with XRE-family HTH domain